MLKTRIVTAVVLLTLLILILFFGSQLTMNVFSTVFFAAACWESCRLFGYRFTGLWTALWSMLFIGLVYFGNSVHYTVVWTVGCVAWIIVFIPALKLGLPALKTNSNQLFGILYLFSVIGCFLAVLIFQQHSSIYLLSVMTIVWVADIGAYFVGKAFGSRKLAVTISPGKSWEGAIGGWVCVMIFGVVSNLASAKISFFSDSFSLSLQQSWGWFGLMGVLTLLTAASVIGDLVESQLKRRVLIKDSSNLLPGHGGVLDRIDALILALPLAILIDFAREFRINP
ncbi:MAG: phosphatidate cytidylyltransferase [Solimicrobium sp.]|jgi:phosphatidate cytidylyltransferase|nr:phosphatidate cytidylyltransferase [Solimicrobium sp.]